MMVLGCSEHRIPAPGRLAKAAAVKRLLLTHFWPEYKLPLLRREAGEYYHGVEMAVEGLDYQILRKRKTCLAETINL